jgi:hypothetical protein
MTIERKLAGIFMQKCSDHDNSKYYENLTNWLEEFEDIKGVIRIY